MFIPNCALRNILRIVPVEELLRSKERPNRHQRDREFRKQPDRNVSLHKYIEQILHGENLK